MFLPSDFWDTIRKNWKQALVVGLVDVFGGALLAFDVYFFWGNVMAEDSGLIHLLLFAGSVLMAMMFCFARYYLYLQLITFRLTLKQLFKNSVLLAMAGMKRNLLISLVLLLFYAIPVAIWFVHPGIAVGVAIAGQLLLFPAFRSFLIQYVTFPLVKKAIIDPYYEEHPGEDIDKRQDLNLEVEKAVSEDETIFTEPAVLKPEGSVVPKQYSAEELRRGNRARAKAADADEDDTI